MQRFKPLEEMYALLAKFEVVVDEGETARLASLKPSWDAFAATLDSGEEAIKRAKVAMKRELTDSLASFDSELAEVRQLSRDNLPYGGDLSIAEANEKLAAWRARIAGWRAREASLAPGLDVFEIPAPDYAVIGEIERELDQLEPLWGLVAGWEADWNSWKTGAFSGLDVGSMEEAAGRYRQRLMKLRDLKKAGVWQLMEVRGAGSSGARSPPIAPPRSQSKIKDFSATMPLIQALGNTALRDRHWQSLMREIGIEFNPQARSFTLEKIVEYGFPKYAEFIEELSASANKELAIEMSLAEIRKVWADMKIDYAKYKEVYFKIRSTEELFQALEDHSGGSAARLRWASPAR